MSAFEAPTHIFTAGRQATKQVKTERKKSFQGKQNDTVSFRVNILPIIANVIVSHKLSALA